MPSVDFAALKTAVPVVDLLAHLGWPAPRREPGGCRGACPLCGRADSRSRTFRLLPSGLWWCYRCATGGDALSLWCRMHPAGPYEGAHAMCEALGRNVPYLPRRARRHRAGIREEAM